MDKMVSVYVHEEAMARMERSNVRLSALCVFLILILLGSNIGWLYYEHKMDKVVTTIEAEQDGSGINYISGGDLSFGTESEDNN